MAKQVTLTFENKLYDNATEILDTQCYDIQMAVTMLLKRVVRDGSVMFLFPSQDGNSRTPAAIVQADDATAENNTNTTRPRNPNKMTKSKAIRLLLNAGQQTNEFVTFASKNKSAAHYWANTEFTVLNNSWSLILNDWINKKLYLFNIPPRSIGAHRLTARADKPDIIDLQIMYGDATFTDNRSGYSFKRFLTFTIEY